MLNSMYGLQDDLDANFAPDEAKLVLSNLIDICEGDFAEKYGGDEVES